MHFKHIFKFLYYYYRVQGEGYIHYKAMLISVVLQVLLLMFEVLVCDKLENNRHWWILVFVPLIFISIISVVVCIWAAKHDRSFEVLYNFTLMHGFLFNLFIIMCQICHGFKTCKLTFFFFAVNECVNKCIKEYVPLRNKLLLKIILFNKVFLSYDVRG